MKNSQMSEGERETYAWLVNKTKPELKRHRCQVISASVVMFLVGLGVIVWYWLIPTVSIAQAFR